MNISLLSTVTQRHRPRFLAGTLLCSLLCLSTGLPQAAQAQSASASSQTESVFTPMVGAVEMTEARIWVQTADSERIKIHYWMADRPQQEGWTPEVQTQAEDSYTHTFVLGPLQSSTHYRYEIWQNGRAVKAQYPQSFTTQTFWQNRTVPPDFTLALGSCAYLTDPPSDPAKGSYGGDYQIFKSIVAQHPDFMLWMGDNMYLRYPDFYAQTAIDRRYRQLRRLPEIQTLLSALPQYAIWDDHDYGDNDADRSYRLRPDSLRNFQNYWANPSYGTPEAPGVFTHFQWSDAEFFLTDDRYYRAPNPDPDPQRDFFGPAQLQWLKDSLIGSDARFKIIVIGNQVLNTQNPSENMYTYQREYTDFLHWLQESQIPGVILLSGDRHHSEMLKQERPGWYPLYEWTVSPLTANAYPPFPEEQEVPQRIPGSLFVGRNFGLLHFSGPPEKRVLEFSLRDSNGKEHWHYRIQASELEPQKRGLSETDPD